MLRNIRDKRFGLGLHAGTTYPFTQKRLPIVVIILALLIIGVIFTLPFFRSATPSAPKEVLSKRTANSITFANKDGTLTSKIYANPVNYKDSKGKWHKIDTTLKASGDGSLISSLSRAGSPNTPLPFKVSFSKDIKKPLTFSIGRDNISFSPVNSSRIGINPVPTNETNVGEGFTPSRTSVSKNKAIYKEIYINTDLERIITPQGLKQNYILKEPGHPTTFKEEIGGDLTPKSKVAGNEIKQDLTPKLESDGSIGYYNGAKKIAFSPKPYLVDAKGKKMDLKYEVRSTKSEGLNGQTKTLPTSNFQLRTTLTLSLPSLSGLAYPIKVDPSVLLTVTWTTKEDFENNAVTTGQLTTRSQVDTLSSSGSVKLATTPDYGDGSDGPLDVNSGTFNLSTQTSGYNGRTAPDGVVTYITSSPLVANITDRFTVADASGFQASDLIFITNTYSRFDDVAPSTQETARIKSVSSNTIILASPLSYSYDNFGYPYVSVTRIPQYTSVLVAPGATLTADGWSFSLSSGAKGGQLLLKANDPVNGIRVQGSIDLTGKGYAGGAGPGRGGSPAAGGYTGCQLGGGGAGYGALGGAGGGFAGTGTGLVGGLIYSDNPLDIDFAARLGSGGSFSKANCNGSLLSQPGGSGGGFMKLSAPVVDVSGSLQANGAGGIPNTEGGTGSGGGSGGSIYLEGGQISVSGVLSAAGGGGAAGGCLTYGGDGLNGVGGSGGNASCFGRNSLGGAGAGPTSIPGAGGNGSFGSQGPNGGIGAAGSGGGGGGSEVNQGGGGGGAAGRIAVKYSESYNSLSNRDANYYPPASTETTGPYAYYFKVNPYRSTGYIGNTSQADTGLRFDTGQTVKAKWTEINFDGILSSTGANALKFALRISNDGINWSTLKGRDGADIDWSSNYFGQIYGSQVYSSIPASIEASRFLDIVVRLESDGSNSPALNSVDLQYEPIYGFPVPTVVSSAEALSTNSIKWNFTDNSNNEDGFRLDEPGTPEVSKGTTAAIAGTGSSGSITETNLLPNTRYTRHIHAFNGAGDSTPSADISIATLSDPPRFPTATNSTLIDQIGVSWLGSPNADHYHVYKDGPAGIGILVYDSSNTFFIDNVSAGSSHTYYIYSANMENANSLSYVSATGYSGTIIDTYKWTTKSDFENNDVTTKTATERTKVDTSSSPGDVKLDLAQRLNSLPGLGWATLWDCSTKLAPAGGKVYALQGMPYVELLEYDPSSNSWYSKASLSGVGFGCGFTSNSINGRLYALPGNFSTGFYEYIPEADVWLSKAAAPIAISESSILTYDTANNKVFAFLSDGSFWEYDPVTDMWTGKTPSPGGMGPLAFNSTTGKVSSLSDNLYEYASTTDSWRIIGPAPSGGRSLIYNQSNGKFYSHYSYYIFAGGASGSMLAYTYLYEYDSNDNEWSTKAILGSTTDFVWNADAGPAVSTMTYNANQDKFYLLSTRPSGGFYEFYFRDYQFPGIVSKFKINASPDDKAEWSTIDWTGQTPAGTAIKFRTRGAYTEADLGNAAWSSYYTTPGSAIQTAASKWLEAELTLESADGTNTPVLNDFTITSLYTSAVPVANIPKALSSNSIKWNFTDKSTGEDGFKLHDSSHNTMATVPANSSSITETGLLPNTTYTRHIHAYKGAVDSYPSADIVKTTLSEAPTLPVATDGTLVDQIQVSWVVSPNADHYHVYKDGPAGVGALVYNSTGTSFIDNVTNNNSHTYYIYSANSEDENSDSFISDSGFRMRNPFSTTWTTKGDFENNASTTGTATNRSNVFLTGVNPTDDSSVSLSDFQAIGVISDLKIDAGENRRARWSTLSWNSAALPANTNIKFRTRTSNDNLNWSGWSNYLIQSVADSTSSLADLAAAGLASTRWLELEAVLESTDGLNSPQLDSFSVFYDNYNIPKAPTSTSSTSLSSSSIKWNFTDNSNIEDGFKLHDSSHSTIATVPANSSSITETGLLPNTIYTRHVHAYIGADDSDPSADIAKITLAEPPLGPVMATDGTLDNQIEVSWPSSITADHYHVYKDGPAGVGALVYDSNGTSFIDNVVDNDVHVYYVYAANSEDENSASYIFDSGYQSFINQAIAPTIGVPEALSENSIQWNFTDNSSNEKGFVLHDTAHNTIATVKANSSEITENGLVPNTSYSRHIHAFNAVGDSFASAEATRYTLPVAHNILPDKQVGQWYNDSVNFFVNAAGFGPGGVAYYRYVWNQDAIYNFSNLETQWLNGILAAMPSASGAWYLHVKPFNGENIPNGVTNFGPFYFDLETPSAPSQLTLTLALTASSPNQIDLSWNDAADSGGSGLAGYKIERAVDVGGVPGTFSQIATSTATSYKDEGLAYNTKYWYRVAAYDNANNVGNYSESVSKATLPKPPTWTTRGDFENNAVTTGTPTNPTANIFISGRNASDDSSVTLGDLWSPSGSTMLIDGVDKFYPTIASNPTTNQYLVAWNGYFDIYARLVNSDSSLGAKFTVSTGRKPAIAYNSITNQYLIVYEDGDIKAQLVNADGSLIGSKFAVHVPNVAAFEPAVAYNSIDNQFMVATSNQSSSLPRVYVQRINADGSLVGTTLNISSGSSPTRPEIAYNSVDNQFLVTWASSGNVEAQRINASGTLAGSKFVVATLNGSSVQKSALAYNSLNNQFMVAWHDNPVGNYDIYAQKVNADGTLAGSQFSLTSAADDEALASAVYVPGTSQFMLIWENITTSQIYGQATNSNGVLTGQSFSLPPTPYNGSSSLFGDPPRIAYNPTLNQFMLTYNNNNVYELYIQRLEKFVNSTGSTGSVSGFKINAGSAMGGWSNIYWNANTPANTSVKFKTRGADTEAGLATANWDGPGGVGSNTYYSSSGSLITTPASQWLEVELTLESSDGLNYPALNDFSISSYNDQTAPVSQITSPANNTILQGLNASISGTSTDFGGSAVDKVEVSSDGGATWDIASPVGGSWNNWTYNWLLPADGVYNIKTRATDTNGNQEVAGAGVIVTVDNTPPQSFNLIEPANGSRTDTPPIFSWQAATDSSGIAKYQLYINGVLNKDNITSTSTMANGNFINQNYTWFIRAVDNAGNIRDSAIYNFSFFTANSTATWTTKGDFENNASTTQTQTTRTGLSVSGAASTDDADIRLSYGLKTTYAGLSNTNGNGLAGMYFTSATTGYAVGGNEISKTIDSGSTWDYVFQGSASEILNSVYFTDTNTGYAVGSFWEGTQLKGLILKTTDAGATWSRQDITADDIVLNDIHFPNADTGYAVGGSISGASDTILKTADGGLSWSRINLGTSDWLEKVQFLDANTGYIFSQQLQRPIYKTTDGGINWQRLDTGLEIFDFYFTDAVTGYAVGSAGKIFKTTNGAATWDLLNLGITRNASGYSLSNVTLSDIYFTDANTGYAVGSYGTILKTSDAGATWSSGPGNFDLARVHFPTENVGYAGTSSGDIVKITSGYASSGFLGGSAFGLRIQTANGEKVHWKTLHWTASLEDNITPIDLTKYTIQLRVKPTNASDWSGSWYSVNNGVSGTTALNTWYKIDSQGLLAGDIEIDPDLSASEKLEIGIRLTSSDTARTPVLKDLSLDYETLPPPSTNDLKLFKTDGLTEIINRVTDERSVKLRLTNLTMADYGLSDSASINADFQYKVGAGGTWTDAPPAIYDSNTQTSETTLGNLQQETTYYFRSRIKDTSTSGQVRTSKWTEFSSSLEVQPQNVPATPTPGIAEALSTNSIKWNFTDNSNDEEGFKLQDSFHNDIATVPADSSFITETSLLPNTTYTRHFHAYNTSGNSLASVSVSKTTLAEPPLLPITATDGTLANQIQVSWTASPSADHYHVYRDGLANTGALVYNSNGTSFTDNVVDDNTHTYYVYAVNSEDENSASWVSDTGYGVLPLVAPTSGTPEVLSETSIKWNFADNSFDEDGFKLHDASHNTIATVPANSNSITETGLLPNIPYIRHIHAYKGAVDSDPSADITKTTLAEPPLLPITATDGTLANQIQVSWTASPSADHYHVYRDGLANTGALVYNSNGTSFTDNVVDDNTHTYYVYAVNSEDENSASWVSDTGFRMPLPAIPAMGAAEVLSPNSIKWNFTDNATNEDGFKLHDISHREVMRIGANSSSFTETGLAPNTLYTRHIHTYNTAGDSPASVSISQTTLADPPPKAKATDGTLTNRIEVTWTSSSSADHYHVYRDGQAGAGALVYNAGATSFSDQVVDDELHTYYVYSANADDVNSSSFASDTGYVILSLPASPIRIYGRSDDDTYVQKVTTTFSQYTSYPTADNLKAGLAELVPGELTSWKSFIRFNSFKLGKLPIDIISAKVYLKEHPTLDSTGCNLTALYHSLPMNPGSDSAQTLWDTQIHNTDSWLLWPCYNDTYYSFLDVTGHLKEDIAASQNYSYYQITPLVTTDNFNSNFTSSDYAGTASDPYLEVTYAPVAPTLNSFIADGSGQIRLKFTDNSINEDDFHFYLSTSPNPDITSSVSIISSSSKSEFGVVYEKLFTGLSPQTRYYVRARGHDHASGSYSSYSNELNRYTLPSSPLAPIVTATGADKLKISINTNDGNPPSNLYAIYNSTLGKYLQIDGSLGDQPVFIPAASWNGFYGENTDLNSDTAYSYQVQVMDENNRTGSLGEASLPVRTFASPPIGASAIGQDGGPGNYKVKVSWNSGGSQTKFRVFSSSDNFSSIKYEGSATQYEEAGLDSATVYTYRIYAVNGDGVENPAYAEASSQLAALPLVAPSVLFMTADSDAQLSVSFLDNSLSEDDFHFYLDRPSPALAEDFGPQVTSSKENIGNSYTKIFNDLAPNTRYFIRLRAHDHTLSQFSNYSEEVAVYTKAATPLSPSVSASGNDRLIISINGDNPPSTKYAVYNNELAGYIQVDGLTSSNPVYQTVSQWGSQGIINKGLQPNTAYTYKVKAKNGDGIETDFSRSSAPRYTWAQTPFNALVVYTYRFPNSPSWYIDLFWQGGIGDSYQIRGPISVDTSNTTYRYKIDCCGPFGSVYLIYGVNKEGVVNPTPAKVLPAWPPPYPQLVRPRGLSAVAVSSSQINLSWQAPDPNLLPPNSIDSYKIYRDGVEIAEAFGTTYSDTGLAADTAYTYYVKAQSGNNLSDPSIQAQATTFVSTAKLDSPLLTNIRATSPTILSVDFEDYSTFEDDFDFFIGTKTQPTANDGWPVLSNSKSLKTVYNSYIEDFESGNLNGWIASGITRPSVVSRGSGSYKVYLNADISINNDDTFYSRDYGNNPSIYNLTPRSAYPGNSGEDAFDYPVKDAFVYKDFVVPLNSAVFSASYESLVYDGNYGSDYSHNRVALYDQSDGGTLIKQWDSGNLYGGLDNVFVYYLTYDLSAYAGKTVRVYARSHISAPSDSVYLFLDDVSIIGSGQDVVYSYTKDFRNLEPNTKYYVRSKAHGFENDTYSDFSNELAAYTLANIPEAPSVEPLSNSEIRVVVNEAGNSSNTEYAIFNNTASKYLQGDGSLGDTVVYKTYQGWGGTAGFVNRGLTPNTDYTYKVKARNADKIETDFGSNSAQVSTFGNLPTKPRILPPTNITSSSITWNWVDNSYNESGFVVHNEVEQVIATLDTDTTTYTETNLQPDTAYKRHVHALNKDGERSLPSNEETARTLLPGPIKLAVVAEVSPSTNVNISWQPPASWSPAGYKIYRYSQRITNDNLDQAQEIGTTTQTSFINTAGADEVWYYQVTAIHEDGRQSDLATDIISDVAHVSAPSPHGKYSQDTPACANCHRGHTGVAKALMAKNNEQICFACHDGTGSKYNISVTWADEADPNNKAAHNEKLALPATSEVKCAKCHDPHGTDMPWALKNTEEALCFTCHNSASLPNTMNNWDVQAQFSKTSRHAITGTTGDNLVGAKVECSSCHGPHTVQAKDGKKLSDPDNTMSLWTGNKTDFCLKCHDNNSPVQSLLSAIFVPYSILFPNTDNFDFFTGWDKTAYRQGGHNTQGIECTKCHNPHGSNNQRLMAYDYDDSPTESKEENLCLKCHGVSADNSTLYATSTSAQWGSVSSAGEVDTTALQVTNPSWTKKDAFIKFDTSSLANKYISRATLTLRITNAAWWDTLSQDPDSILKFSQVADYGPLDASDFYLPAIANIGSVQISSPKCCNPEPVNLDVTETVKEAAANSVSVVALRVETDTNRINFGSPTETDQAYRPKIEVFGNRMFNLNAVLNEPNRHPVKDKSDLHKDTEDSVNLGGLNRHAECYDCHNPHENSSAPEKTQELAPSAYGAIKGVTGVSVTNNKEPSATLEFKPKVVEKEYELCLKCHSSNVALPPDVTFTATREDAKINPFCSCHANWSFLINPPINPSGIGKVDVYKTNKQDKAMEFNPNNPSFHPVEAAGKNLGIKDETFVEGTPWNPTSGNDPNYNQASAKVYCTDCHGQPNTGLPSGPHGSPNKGILKAPFQQFQDFQAPYPADTTDSVQADVCFLCHNSSVYLSDRANELGSRYPHEMAATLKGGCGYCHTIHGSTKNKHLMRDDISDYFYEHIEPGEQGMENGGGVINGCNSWKAMGCHLQPSINKGYIYPKKYEAVYL